VCDVQRSAFLLCEMYNILLHQREVKNAYILNIETIFIIYSEYMNSLHRRINGPLHDLYIKLIPNAIVANNIPTRPTYL
jgi:hypothetical protein